MEYQRRTSINPETFFTNPLIIYKYSAEKAYSYCMRVIEYLLLKPFVSKIFVEDIIKLNLESLIKFKLNELDIKDTDIDTYSENLNIQGKEKIKKFERFISTPDLCIVIGGDGTTLWTNHLFESLDKPPFLNFNLGSLGYMAIYSCESYKEVLDELFSPDKIMTFEKRSTLNANIFKSIPTNTTNNNYINLGLEQLDINTTSQYNPVIQFQGNALNDVTLERTQGETLITIKVYLNDEPLTVVKCDGLIISTSTGSTAYNLSAGGGVIHYDVDAMILNAICPHSLSFRSITFSRGATLKFVPCNSSNKKVLVNLDCIDRIELKDNEYVEVSLSNKHVNFIVLEKFVKNRTNLWKQKIVDQLGWNNAFKNVD